MSAPTRVALAGAVAALATTILATAPPAASEDNLSVTVKDVAAKVSRTGGITVSGTMNCGAAVDRAGGVPENANVMVGVTWTAWQSAGRKGMVTASWPGGAHADACYTTRAGVDPSLFLPWNTSYYNSTGTPYYVFPSNGKFVKGPVHIDVRVEGGYDPETGEPQPNVYLVDPTTGEIVSGTDQSVEVFGVTGFDVRAR